MYKSLFLDLFITQLKHHQVMPDENNIDLIDSKRIKLEDNHENITSFGGTCRNSVVDCFKNKCMKFITNQLDDKSIRAYNAFINTGKKLNNLFIVGQFYFGFFL